MADTKSNTTLSWPSAVTATAPSVGASGTWGHTFRNYLSTLHNFGSSGEVTIARKTLKAGEYVPVIGFELFNIPSSENLIIFISRIMLVGIDSGDTVDNPAWSFGRSDGSYADWCSNRSADFGLASNNAGIILFDDDSFEASEVGATRNIGTGVGVAPGESFGVKGNGSSTRCDCITIFGYVMKYS
jgi:hypothetical protein